MITSVLRFSVLIIVLFPSFVAGQEKATSPGSGYGADSVLCVRKLAEYQELFRQRKFAEAATPWQHALRQCPAATENLYIEGASILDALLKEETDTVRRSILMDSLMDLYDLRIQYFGKEGYVLGRKGVDLFHRDLGRTKEAHAIIERSVDLEKWTSRPAILVNYVGAALYLCSIGELDTNIVMLTYEKTRALFMECLMKNRAENTVYSEAMKDVDATVNRFLGCDRLEAMYTPRFKNDSMSTSMLEGLITTLESSRCATSELYQKACKKVYDRDSTPENALRLGKYFMVKKMYMLALPLMFEAFLCKDSAKAAEAYLAVVTIYYHNDRASFCKQYAMKAHALLPHSGLPLLMLGDCYAVESGSCGTNDFERQAVYWTAVDKYIEAAEIDPSIRPLAEKRIAAYSALFPEKETLFFNEVQEGSWYSVDCWIQEKTRVRARKKQ